MAELRTEARFPQVASGRGHYESFFIRAFHPDEPIGVWIRYTVLKRPDREPRGSLWLTLFDAGADGPVASKATLGPGEVSAEPPYIRVAEAGAVGDGLATGHVEGASWELSFESAEPPLRHLPKPWMYRAPIPRTKLLSPYPAATFSGHVAVGERRLELDGWQGTTGHNWGAQHAERWIWMHGAAFDGDERTWLDLGLGRIKLGPVTTPWTAAGAISIDGERHPLGGPAAARRTKVHERPDACQFTIPGSGLTVCGEVAAPKKDFVGWVYSDPDGGEHNTVNCSIARMELTIEREGQAPQRLTTAHGAAYELGMRESDHGVPIQPFPDP
ncbi:MAG TPA: hypothetical protein VJT75_17825 [Thermoleophilaceae bacterium]|nr:hypothetical protein [Thermoleophilaceae bacterium]